MNRRLAWILSVVLLFSLLPITSVTAITPPLEAYATLSPNPVPAGGNMEIQVHIIGGIAPYLCFTQVHFEEDNGLTFAVDLDGTDARQVYTMNHGRRGHVEVEVHDVRGAVIWVDPVPFTVTGTHADELTATVTTDKEWYDRGESVTATCSAQGGTPPYTYEYTLDVFEQGHLYNVMTDSRDTTPFTFYEPLPFFGDGGQVSVKVTDVQGRTVACKQPIKLGSTYQNPLKLVSATLQYESVQVKGIQAIQLEVEGGDPPYRVYYVWEIYENGAPVDGRVDNNVTSMVSTYAPTFGDHGTVSATVLDSQGRSVDTEELHFDIVGDVIDQPFEVTSRLSALPTASGGVQLTTHAQVRGGVPPFEYWFEWEERDANGYAVFAPKETLILNERTARASRTYTKEGNQPYLAAVSVIDKMGRRSYIQWHYYTGVIKPEMPGDANGDNSLDILDLVSIIDFIVNRTPCQDIASADANGDGIVDILDLVWIIDRIVAS